MVTILIKYLNLVKYLKDGQMNSMFNYDAFYRVKMVEMDMVAWGLMEERQVN